jgi:HD superfamily phosphodiesterase
LDDPLAAATIALLHDAGKADVEEAALWVHANLIPEHVTRTYPGSK